MHPDPNRMIDQWLEMGEDIFPPGLKKPVWQCTTASLRHADPESSGVKESAHAGAPASTQDMPSIQPAAVTVRVSHLDAHRLLACCSLNEDYYDLVDVDSFGSDTSFLGSAIEAVRSVRFFVDSRKCHPYPYN